MQSRRNFLKSSASATAVALLPAFHMMNVSETEMIHPAASGFELLFMATNWGFKGDMDQFCKLAKEDGYDGIEVWWPGAVAKQEELFNALKKYGLQVGLMCANNLPDYDAHLEGFKKNLDACTSNKYQKPVYINCHSGKDFFTYEQNKAIIDYVTLKNKESGIPVYHETHRSRMLFCAHITKQFIDKNPDIRLTLDISHWCTVHTSLLDDQKEAVNLALEHTDHIHSRVGHTEGPQVSDPRAPEWAAALNAHLSWWDKVVARKKAKGERMTILTEFGPPNYMPTLPYTRQPVADQWAINVYMKDFLKKRYSK